MLENAISLVHATCYVSLLGKLKEPIYAIMVPIIAGILIGVSLMHLRHMGAKGRVNRALIDFASSWELIQAKKRLNMYRDIIPTVKKGETIKEAVEKVPITLTRRDFSCALDIANRLGLIKTAFETKNKPPDPFGSGGVGYNTRDIDELAKRARECVEELERWWYKK